MKNTYTTYVLGGSMLALCRRMFRSVATTVAIVLTVSMMVAISPALAAEPTAVIETKFGNISIEFLSDRAPNHVANFIELAKSGFYDGTIFHRVIPGFMIQGGDPNTKSPDTSKYGTGGPGYTVNAEFNNTPHTRGILSMARSRNPNSAGSQFFIVVRDSTFLDRKYTVFGRVTEGMDVADKIVSQPRDNRDNPLERVEMTVKILDAES